MLNHAPAMLLNRPMDYYAGQPNLIYIPAEFPPVVLPPALQRIRNVLFPDGTSPSTELSIVHRLLPIVHMPEYQPYVDVWDSRKTYEVSAVGRVAFVSPSITVTSQQTAACDMAPKYRIVTDTEPIALSSSGNFTWKLRTGSSVQTAYTDLRGVSRLVTIITSATYGTGRSAEIALIPGRLFAFLTTPSDTLTGDYTYTYNGIISPTYPLASVARDMDVALSDGSTCQALFAPFAPVEGAMRTLRFTYDSSTEQTLRFGAALMAMIYQVSRLTVMRGQYNV
jgi:hypothetical protein